MSARVACEETEVTPAWVTDAAEVVKLCSFTEYTFRVVTSNTTKMVYLVAQYLEAYTVTGRTELQTTRRWPLSPEMTRSEIVATAFKCVMTSMEHRTREWFLYDGRAIHQPHYDVDTLWSVCQSREVRTPHVQNNQ